LPSQTRKGPAESSQLELAGESSVHRGPGERNKEPDGSMEVFIEVRI